MISRPPTRLLVFAAALAAVLVALAGAGVAGAQADDPLTRYDSESTAELAAESEENERRAEELEDEIDALEAEGDYGDRWDAAKDELSEIPDETAADNALGDARIADVESAPLPDEPEAKARELRKKSESLGALEAWASTSEINIDSRLYSLMGSSEASELASTYREEAGVLEVEANAAEVARQERESAEEAAKPEPKPETQGAAPGGGDGGEEPVEEEPAPAPEPAPEEAAPESGTGFLGGVNIVPIAVFAALVAGGIFALSRSAGVSIGKFFSPAMAEVRKTKPRPKKKPAPKPKTKAASASKTGPSTPEEERRPTKPRTELDDLEPEARDEEAERLAEWFQKEAPEPLERPKPGPGDEAGDALPDDEEPPE